MNIGRSQTMSGIEEAREQVITYEQGLAEAQAELQAFKAENADNLEAIKSEFEDYTKHPMWVEYSEKQARTYEPTRNYGEWYYQGWAGEDTPDPDFSWQGKVLFSGRPGGYGHKGHRVLNIDNPNSSILPLSVEEFDRRATIAEHIGEVATMLHDHSGEPVVSIASYTGKLQFENAYKTGHNKHTYGQVSWLPTIRAIVGTINQTESQPVLSARSASAVDDSPELGLRFLTLADSVAGIVTAYSLPDSKRQLKRQTSPPSYSYTSNWSLETKHKTLPLGNSLIGDFPLDELRGHDLLVIDGPHQTAADHVFSDDIVLHRPKQKIETDGQSVAQEAVDQEVVVTPARHTGLHEATVISEDGEVVLPSLRHDTIWLIGAKAIKANLADAIWDLADPVSQQRYTNVAIARAARDLVKRVRQPDAKWIA